MFPQAELLIVPEGLDPGYPAVARSGFVLPEDPGGTYKLRYPEVAAVARVTRAKS